MDKRIKNAEKKIFRCARCGKVIKGVMAVTKARREGCAECGAFVLRRTQNSGMITPLEATT